MKTVFKGIIDALFPPRCPYCDEVQEDDEPCDNCRKLLTACRIAVRVCDKCGNEIKYCDCNKFNRLYNGASGVYWNKADAKEAVYAIKFHNRPYVAEYFGRQMAVCFKNRFPEAVIDGVCAVPMSKKKQRKNGYNHAELLAKSVSKALNKPYVKNALLKIKDNPSQHGLSAALRAANVKGAYKANSRFDGKNLLLIDDVLTTGLTLSECAKQLRLAGANEVYCAVALVTSKYTCKTDDDGV